MTSTYDVIDVNSFHRKLNENPPQKIRKPWSLPHYSPSFKPFMHLFNLFVDTWFFCHFWKNFRKWDRFDCSILVACSVGHVQAVVIVPCSELHSVKNCNELSQANNVRMQMTTSLTNIATCITEITLKTINYTLLVN